jgi:hypothetical protein
VNLPRTASFDLHARLSNCKRVQVFVLLQVSQTVIHKSVGRLVGSHGFDYVQERSILGQTPVIDGNVWSRLVLPFWNSTGLDLRDTFCTGETKISSR